MTRPIVVGPWRSEAGFELLYWLPWLRKLFSDHKIAPERVHVITRGGAGPWYGVPESNVVDLYHMRPMEDLREESARDILQTGVLKQFRVTPFDRSLLEQAVRHWGLQHYFHLHPMRMYTAFRDVFALKASPHEVMKRTAWDPLPVPGPPANLPPKYYVAGFYTRATLQGDHRIVKQINTLVRGVAARYPVVLLRNPHHVDDHMDIPIEGEHIHVPPPVPAAQTLAFHTALTAHSLGFIGTYGGLAQLALRLGKPSVSVYEQLEGTSHAHMWISTWLSEEMHVPFVALKLREIPLVATVLSQIEAEDKELSS